MYFQFATSFCLRLVECLSQSCPSACQHLHLSCSFQLAMVIIQTRETQYPGKGLHVPVRSQTEQQWGALPEWELLGSPPTPLLCSRQPLLKGQRGFSMMKAAIQLGGHPDIRLSHAKLMLQLHWRFQNLTLSFLFAPLSCSLSLPACLSVPIKCHIKYCWHARVSIIYFSEG